MSYFIYSDAISSLLDPRLVDPGSTLIHVGAFTALRVVCTNVDQNLIADLSNFRAKYLQNGEKN